MVSSNSMATAFFLVDCNNFYVSCERVFRPELEGKPVVVLSNNDGCFISRSDEVKFLNIPMGAPYFKYKKEVELYKMHVFSANFSLYGDISHRIMSTLASFCSKIEVYSIDEAFMEFNDIDEDKLTEFAHEIRRTIKKWTGIPVSIGIGSTKTLAKLANKIARKYGKNTGGVYNISSVPDIDRVLGQLPVDMVWGVGRQSTLFLNSEGVKTVLQLKNSNDTWLQKNMSIVGVRIAWELRGISCLPLEEVRPTKKGILSSRSFGRPIKTLTELKESVATFTGRAAEKLRGDKCLAGCITVHVRTNRFDPFSYYSNSFPITLPMASADTSYLVCHAFMSLEKIYRPGSRYKKAGIFLSGIVPDNRQQLSLFEKEGERDKRSHLMTALDKINDIHGRRVVRFASEGVARLWSTKSEQRSPSYTTDWKSLPQVM